MKRLTPIERFWIKVDKNGPTPSHRPHLGRCWVWTSNINTQGYGTFHYEGRPEYAHRFAWFLKTGRWPNPNALHRCDNSECVRWSHLFEGTHLANTRDMVRKGRARYVGLPGSKNGCAKLTEKEVAIIKRGLRDGVPQDRLAKLFDVSQTLIHYINTGRNWTHVTI